jgi:hypothetical protein
MNKPKKLSVVIVEHARHCFMRDEDVPWSGLSTGFFWGNLRAKITKNGRGCNYIWHKVTCNDPNCPAIKAVHSSVLAEA